MQWRPVINVSVYDDTSSLPRCQHNVTLRGGHYSFDSRRHDGDQMRWNVYKSGTASILYLFHSSRLNLPLSLLFPFPVPSPSFLGGLAAWTSEEIWGSAVGSSSWVWGKVTSNKPFGAYLSQKEQHWVMLIFLKSKSLNTGTNTNYTISRRRSSITRCEQYKSGKTQHVSKNWDGPARSAKILICPFVWYQNIRSTLFGFITKHACDRQTGGRTGRITTPETALT